LRASREWQTLATPLTGRIATNTHADRGDASMNRAEYLSAVNEFFYQGEVLGEAVFTCYAALETDAARRRKWAVCLQLETETKARLRPFLMRLGLGLAPDDVAARVAEFGKAYATKSWRQHMEEVVAITDFFLEKFRAIEEAAPDDERDMARSMVIHESALNKFGRLELAGDTQNSLADVVAQLHWPL
jgi:hypothetical protein